MNVIEIIFDHSSLYSKVHRKWYFWSKIPDKKCALAIYFCVNGLKM